MRGWEVGLLECQEEKGDVGYGEEDGMGDGVVGYASVLGLEGGEEGGDFVG